MRILEHISLVDDIPRLWVQINCTIEQYFTDGDYVSVSDRYYITGFLLS